MVKKATRISRLAAAVENQPVIAGRDVHKKTYSVALFSKENGLKRPAFYLNHKWSKCPESTKATAGYFVSQV